MPSRRSLLTGLGVGLSSAVTPTAGALPRSRSRPSVDLPETLARIGSLDAEITGRLGPEALRGLRAVDTGPLAGIDGLPSVPDLDIRVRAAADGALPVSVAPLSRTLGDDLSTPPLDPVDESLAEADARTTVSVTGTSDVPDAMDGVRAVGLGVWLGTRPVVRVAVAGTDGHVPEARVHAVLDALGLPTGALSGAETTTLGDARVLTRAFGAVGDGPLARRDDEVPFVAVLFLLVVAAVVGTFVLGMGGSQTARAPQVSFAFETRSDGSVTITHRGGDHVDASRLRIRYTVDGQTRVERWRDDDGTVMAGDSFTTRAAPDPETAVRVVWSSTDQAATLGKFTVQG